MRIKKDKDVEVVDVQENPRYQSELGYVVSGNRYVVTKNGVPYYSYKSKKKALEAKKKLESKKIGYFDVRKLPKDE